MLIIAPVVIDGDEFDIFPAAQGIVS